MYIFYLDSLIVVALNQKDNQDNERKISFMSTKLQGSELNYPTMDKQTSTIYKVIKHYSPYIFKSHVIVLVTQVVVHSFFVQ